MRYATPENWAKYFREVEGVQIGRSTIRNRIRESGIAGKTVRNKIGNILKNSFYSESAIRQICSDIIQEIPQANEDGFFTKNNERFGTIAALARVLSISGRAIQFRLKTHSPTAIKGKDGGGRIWDFYSELEIHQICSDLLKKFPKADNEGVIVEGDKRYGTIEILSSALGISRKTIVSRIKMYNLRAIKGKTSHDHIHNFYLESEIRQICSDIIQEIPQANEDGFFTKDNERFGTIKSLSRIIGISETCITAHIKICNPHSIKGKIRGGRVFDFYSESEIRKICGNLLKDLSQPDDNGFIVKYGQKYGTISIWAEALKISASSITRHIKAKNCLGIKGKMKGGQIYDFYPESVIRQLCADLLNNIDQADANGFFTKDGQIYGTKRVLSKKLGISATTIDSRVKASSLQRIKVKDSYGHICDFYPESTIRQICADILEKRKNSEL